MHIFQNSTAESAQCYVVAKEICPLAGLISSEQSQAIYVFIHLQALEFKYLLLAWRPLHCNLLWRVNAPVSVCMATELLYRDCRAQNTEAPQPFQPYFPCQQQAI